MQRRCWRSLTVVIAAVFGCMDFAEFDSLVYPAARRAPIVDDYFGIKIADPYRWMEELDSPELKRWVEMQNALTSNYLSSLPEREALRRRITELWNYSRATAPRYARGRWFYSRNPGLQRQAIVFTRETLDGPETVALDPNGLSPDGGTALSGFFPAPDGTHLAYGLSQSGSDWSTYYVRDLRTGKELPEAIRWVRSLTVAWTKDGKGFFYGRYPEPLPGQAMTGLLRDKKIYYHRLGTPQAADTLIYERPDDPTLFIEADIDETGQYLFIQTFKSVSSNELFVKNLGDPFLPSLDAPIHPLYVGHTAFYKPLGVVNGILYLLTDRDAPHKKVVSVSMADPDPKKWKAIVNETRNAIETAQLLDGKLAVNALVDAQSDVRLYQLDGATAGSIVPPGPGTIAGPYGQLGRPEIFYTFTSPLHPATVFQFDSVTGRNTPFEPPSLTFRSEDFVTRRVFVASKDGTRFPVFITHRKELKKDDTHPTILYGFGGFGISELPQFRPAVVAFLERGGVYATANIRGGNEYGEDWHRAGMLEKKQNAFDDFIAAAEYLLRERYASPATLGIMGASNGGLLVAAVMEQRPDLFSVVLPAVAVTDMLRFHHFTGGAAGVAEYGSSETSNGFAYLLKYSPLHNVTAGACYPATLITTADNDDRVVPSHSYKFAATLQAAQGCQKPVLLRVEAQGSHTYRPTDRRIAEVADQWAFALANLADRPAQHR